MDLARVDQERVRVLNTLDEVEKLGAVGLAEVLGVELNLDDVGIVVVKQELLCDALLNFLIHFACLEGVVF